MNRRWASKRFAIGWVLVVAILLLIALGLWDIDRGEQSDDSVSVDESGGGMVVTFIGDSLTNGWAATTYEDSFVPKAVALWSSDRPIVTSVTAISGAKTKKVAAAAVIDSRSRIVVLELGTNDVRRDDRTAIPQFEQDYRELVRKVEADAQAAIVVCLGVWRSSSDADEYDNAIRNLCAGTGKQFVPLSDLYEDADMRGPSGRRVFLGKDGAGDDFHPNDLGYTKIAERITGLVRLTN
jgi:lysophospholipase L1-like esterase